LRNVHIMKGAQNELLFEMQQLQDGCQDEGFELKFGREEWNLSQTQGHVMNALACERTTYSSAPECNAHLY